MTRKFAVCSVEIVKNGSEVQLFPAGEFRARDGRPGPGKVWRMTESSAAAVMLAAVRRKTPMVIDYEHQSLNTEKNGQPAPAAGWFSDLEWRPGEGLYAKDVAWTAAARARIEADEYRYISPVFSYATDGAVLELYNAALTNNPAIDGMDVVAAATFSIAREGESEGEMQALLKLLGLADDAGEDEAVAAVKALLDDLAALKEKSVDAAKFVPIGTFTALRDELAALTAQVREKEVSGLVAAALADGRLLPAMEGWARNLGANDVVALRTFIDAAQPIAALTATQTGGKPPAGGEGALDDTALAVCRQMGVSAEDYKKTLGAA